MEQEMYKRTNPNQNGLKQDLHRQPVTREVHMVSLKPTGTAPRAMQPSSAQPRRSAIRETQTASVQPRRTAARETETDSAQPRRTVTKETQADSAQPRRTATRENQAAPAQPRRTATRENQAAPAQPRRTATRENQADSAQPRRSAARETQMASAQPRRSAARENQTASAQPGRSAARENQAAPAQPRRSAARETQMASAQPRRSAYPDVQPASVQRRKVASSDVQMASAQRRRQVPPEVQARRRKIQQRKRRRHIIWVTVRTVLVLFLLFIVVGKGWEYLSEQREIRQAQSDGGSSFAVFNDDGSLTEESLSMDNVAVNFPEGTDYIKYLQEMTEEYPQIKDILANQDQYPDKLLEMLSKNPETLDFVQNYPEEKNKEHKITIDDTYVHGEIPLYIQWDSQWGYDNYGDGMIALDGCGPTCLSMVYIGLTGDTSMNPREMSDYSNRNGYLTSSGATAWDLMLSGASGLGLASAEVSLDESVIRRELEAGHPIICSMRPGDFTTTGHFIVLTGIAEDGTIIVNDPNSRLRSKQTWELGRLMEQMKNLWSFSMQF